MHTPRLLLTATSSGSGKTTITCGILQAMLNRRMKPVSFKCGPDYIDPAFHSTVIGIPSYNLDTFFTDENTTRYLFSRHAKDADLAVIEGVMGYYDGLGGISEKASAFDVAGTVAAPAVLIVDGKGMSVSMLALIKGFLTYQEDSHIQGVILNRVSGMMYPELKKLIEEKLGIKAYGYVPEMKELTMESRHLGLVMPGEIPDLRSQLNALAEKLEETLDLDGLLELAKSAPELECEAPVIPKLPEAPVIAVARDEGFCFYYADNLELLEDMGAKLVYFSPIHDKDLPACDGLILGGGYPELYVKELSANVSMRDQIKSAIESGLPVMAECGGFMYLQQEMEDMENKSYPVCGVLEGKAYRTAKLGRFGYICLEPVKEQMLGMDVGQLRGHEFHYFDTTCNGDSFHASKPLRKRNWDCIVATDTCIAGFPHLYYYSNLKVPAAFLKKCLALRKEK